MNVARAICLTLASLLLSGCIFKGPASVLGGECKIFEAPRYVVLGKRAYDQNWINDQVEAGVGGCNWQRPKARPASIDGAPSAQPAQKKRRGLIRRLTSKIAPAKEIEAPRPVPHVSVPAASAPPPKPADPIDELLNPRAFVR